MLILGIETSGAVGSVALCEGIPCRPGGPAAGATDRGLKLQTRLHGARAVQPAPAGREAEALSFRILIERVLTEGLIHGRELAPAVKAVLAERGITATDLGLIAVSQGPGSYTGLRVGLSFAKTLAWGARRPLVGVGSLAAMAENVSGAPIAVPVIDARWGQIYGAMYQVERREKREESAWKEILAPMAAAPGEFAVKIPAGAAIFGDALKRYRDVLLKPGVVEGDASWAIPKASTVARLGAAAFAASGGRDEMMTLVPHYLRPTEAEVNVGLKKK
jgi:tRNA threonylcarbamoyladenosine biosynthesis protein TsaB